MVVQHNIRAMNSNRQLGITTGIQAKSSEKLSSGYKINRAADDAAGLAISEKMRRQVRGLTQASSNAQDGISVVQTAEGALNEVHDMLQRMNELATKAANDTLQSVDRAYIQQEVAALSTEITRTAEATEFNNQKLLNGKFTGKNLQVGSETNSQNQIMIDIQRMSASILGVAALPSNKINSGTNVTTATKVDELKNKNEFDSEEVDGHKIEASKAGADQISVMSHSLAKNAIMAIKNALVNVSTMRSNLGAIQNRLEHTIKNLDNVVENTTSAESQIRDTDMASEMVKYSNNNILAQAGQSMLAQANQSNQGVLSLLG
ncbi:flagellin N-terminal helical domain-containing protein [Butyrivibrio sp. AE2032]|uniref:flagellin N-terminal helical domain-containing protein n=1 Tax=Butyrivibrio sp. AE2032 TaxID=1458463 RepID=UPI000559547B|nr:flagellin [Butyrivibrio sp. AE2032]